jgi:hypothetical protein
MERRGSETLNGKLEETSDSPARASTVRRIVMLRINEYEIRFKNPRASERKRENEYPGTKR